MVLKSRFFLVLILVFSAVVLGSDPAGTPALSVQQKESATESGQAGHCSPFLNDQLATRNPAAVYCLGLGYDYLIITDATGGQHGNCILPDQTECPAWDFLSGKCGQARSICAREGLETVTLSDGNDPFSDEYAVCADSKGKLL